LIVSVSRHDARKGLNVLLNALAQLKARAVPFRACLVGGGQLLEHHRRLAANLGLEGLVALPGAVPDSFAYLLHADIFVLPSLEEGSGSVSLLEAMQAAVAPIVSGVDGLVEDIVDEVNGLLVRAGDTDDLANALSRCIASPALREKLAKGARASFEQRFSVANFVKDITRIYSQFGVYPTASRPEVLRDC
jgi:glycosyltransferase involved in cell wall biosynthesis